MKIAELFLPNPGLKYRHGMLLLEILSVVGFGLCMLSGLSQRKEFGRQVVVPVSTSAIIPATEKICCAPASDEEGSDDEESDQKTVTS